MKSVQGKIIKGIAGFYYVACEGEIYSCKAKGAFRNQKIKPLVGDDVLFDITDKEKQIGNIVELLPRKNSLIRPAVSNVDQAVVVLAFTHPDPQLYLLDKYLIMMSRQNVEIAILWNKADIASKTDRLRANIYQDAGFFTMQMSVASGEGIDDFRSYLRGKSSVLAGPSGVGKSSLTNVLCPMALMQTQDISKKFREEDIRLDIQNFFMSKKTPIFVTLQVLLRSILKICQRKHCEVITQNLKNMKGNVASMAVSMLQSPIVVSRKHYIVVKFQKFATKTM